jgi:hypothetical protein
MDEKVRFIEGVERQIREAGRNLLEARRTQCETFGHHWRELQTNLIPNGSPAMYCEHCKVVDLNGTIEWPVTPQAQDT